ncbi:hypothetical protein OCU04_010791 [Sclerotinia nivalis]|uniref:Uncharacterized protein n=1 Tax=Sclerotinia nivalis TaxID=352851 RepID=A0A9X0DH12_9HELO|nr:hypothetical protein OCU04_010791 [Sclerotinia nivalis]
MSSQQPLNGQSENSSVPLPSSQADPQIPTGIRSLPLELVGRIFQEVMKNEGMNTNTNNRTRSLPAFVNSLKCDVGQPWRGQYLFALDTCNRDFVYSLHFGNDWKLLMDSEERQLVRNIVVKYVPGQAVYSEQADQLEAKKSAGQLSNVEATQYYSMVPLPEDLNTSLNDLPDLRSVQLEFKTFLPAFKNTFLGMFRVLKSFLDDHEDFKLKDAMIEPGSNGNFSRAPNRPGWEIAGKEIERILIPQITEIAGRDVCFLLPANNIWKLEDAKKRDIAAENTVDFSVDDFSYILLGCEAARVLRHCTWTFIFERAVHQY